jgi:MtN3 and saliva related transmembrane protein
MGFVAGAIVSFSYLPQIIRVFRLKSAHEISYLFTTFLLIGILLWLTYGIIFHLGPVILWNAVGGIQAAVLLYAKIKYGKTVKISKINDL